MRLTRWLSTCLVALSCDSVVLAQTASTITAEQLAQSSQNLTVDKDNVLIVEFQNSQPLALQGNIVNNGSIFAVTKDPSVLTASFAAQNITNNQGALFSTILPAGLPYSSANYIANLSLSLNAINNIVNAGQITSAGNLSLSAGGSIINSAPAAQITPLMQAQNNLNLVSGMGNVINAGVLASLAGNINIASQIAQQLSISNLAGSIQASSGTVNLGSVMGTLSDSVSFTGGSLIARELNFFAGAKGVARIEGADIQGLLNINAGEAHVLANSANLNLGTVSISGDPTFYNNAGDITISGNLTATEDLAIIASRDIKTSGNFTISANNPDGSGANIYLLAGANITASTGAASAQVGGGLGSAATSVTVSGASATGGDIDFSTNNMLISSQATAIGKDGGNVLLAAYTSAGSRGKIMLASTQSVEDSVSIVNESKIQAGAGIGGRNGAVTLIAGGNGSTSIETGLSTSIVAGAISTNGNGSVAGTGSIFMYTAQPGSSNGLPITFDSTGKIVSGNSLVPTIASASAAIQLDDDLNSGGTISLSGSGGIVAPHLVVNVIPISGPEPEGAAINPAGTAVYVTQFGDLNNNIPGKQFSIIDTATNIATVNPNVLGDYPEGVVTSLDGNFVYMASRTGNDDVPPPPESSISVYDVQSGTVRTVYLGSNPATQHPIGVALDPTGQYLYVACRGLKPDFGSIVKLSTAELNSPASPVTITVITGAGVHAPQTVSVSPTGSFVYAANRNSDSITIIQGDQVVGNIPTQPASPGSNPIGVAINPSAAYAQAYAANRVTGQVSVINTNTHSVTQLIAVGTESDTLAFNPTGNFAYVTNEGGKSVSIINSSTNSVIQTVTVGKKPGDFGNFAGFVGANPRAYITNVDSKTVAVISQPVINASSVGLVSSNGSISVGTNTSFLSLSAAANASVTQRSSLTLGSASVGNILQVGTMGQLLVTGPLLGLTTILSAGGGVSRMVAASGSKAESVNPQNKAMNFLLPNIGIPANAILQTDTFPIHIHPQARSNEIDQRGTQLAVDPSSISLFDGFEFDAANLAELSSIEFANDSRGDFLHLLKGSAIFAPKRSIRVKVKAGEVTIEAGSIVLIVENDRSSGIYCMHEEAAEAVTLKSDQQLITCYSGQAIVVSDRSDSAFTQANPLNGLAFRDVQKIPLSENRLAYVADFSISGALNSISSLRRLARSSSLSQQKLYEKLLKTAVCLSMVSPAKGPYRER